MLQQGNAGDPPIGFLRIRKMLPYISQSCSSQKSVHDGMYQYICIGMTKQSVFIIDLYPAKYQVSVFNQSVYIIPCANPHKLTSFM